MRVGQFRPLQELITSNLSELLCESVDEDEPPRRLSVAGLGDRRRTLFSHRHGAGMAQYSDERTPYCAMNDTLRSWRP
jgi:hypothetical protein